MYFEQLFMQSNYMIVLEKLECWNQLDFLKFWSFIVHFFYFLQVCFNLLSLNSQEQLKVNIKVPFGSSPTGKRTLYMYFYHLEL